MAEESWNVKRFRYSLENAIVGRWNPRKFDGSVYYFWIPAFKDKKRVEYAIKMAKQLGYYVRKVKVDTGYDIYVRRR